MICLLTVVTAYFRWGPTKFTVGRGAPATTTIELVGPKNQGVFWPNLWVYSYDELRLRAHEKLSENSWLALFYSWLLRLFCHWSTGLLNKTTVTLSQELLTLSLRYALTTQNTNNQYQLILTTYRWSTFYNCNWNRSKSIIIVNIIVLFSLGVSSRLDLLVFFLHTHIVVP